MQIPHTFFRSFIYQSGAIKGSEYLTTRKGWSFRNKLDTSEFESKKT